MTGRLREIAAPYVAAAPAGARVRTRLRLEPGDADVLTAVGRHLGALASADLAARCADGKLDVKGRAGSRARRKQAMTALSSSRWAGAITRTSEDSWQLGWRNLAAEKASLKARARKISRRLAVPAGTGSARDRGYHDQAERHGKQCRLQVLAARLAEVEQRIADGQVSVCRGGKGLARRRHHLDAAALTVGQWRERWDAERMFLTADGEKDKAWGNETIRWNPDGQWLEVRLPAPFAHLANRKNARYRLSCPVSFPYRGDEVAAQAATGAVRYDITVDPGTGRWYLDASWTPEPAPVPALEALTAGPVLAADLNEGFLAAWTVLPDGNPAGPPATVPLLLTGLSSATRDGRLRAAVTQLITLAKASGCRAIAIENLNFKDARDQGREKTGGRPSRGARGRRFRAMVAGLPTGRFRDRLVQMTSNAGLSVIAVDPAYTSRWGKEHWLAPLKEKTPVTTGHHAAAVVIGRRAHGHGARRRSGVTGSNQRIATRRAATRAPRNRAHDRDDGANPAQQQTRQRHQTATAGPANRPTRRPRTVRGHQIPGTYSCYLKRNGA